MYLWYVKFLGSSSFALCIFVTLVPKSVLTFCEENYEAMTVNKLCMEDWTFPMFPEADLCLSMLIQFSIMNSESLKNDVFYHKMQHLSKALVPEPSLDDLYQKLWIPLFEHCCTVSQGLKKEEITFNDLNYFFQSTDSADIEKTVYRLCTAVAKCCSHDVGNIKSLYSLYRQSNVSEIEELVNIISEDQIDTKWVKVIAKKISDWSVVSDVSSEADFVIEMFEVFQIPPKDFVCFSKQVCNSTNLFIIYKCNYNRGFMNFFKKNYLLLHKKLN